MRSRAALLWDESFFWGIMMYDALICEGIDFDIIRADDIRQGRLSDYSALFVPGGWASNKLKALGHEGAVRIRDFVASGGAYAGVCGGAGLATSDGIALLDIKRKPLRDRVPSLSGSVRLSLDDDSLWEGIREPSFHIWWPSQFVLNSDGLRVHARFESAGRDAFSSDYPVAGMSDAMWKKAEETYGINLDPGRMAGDPLVVEGRYGNGTVLASLVHFDTPLCPNGGRMLRNLCKRLGLSMCRSSGGQLKRPSGRAYEIAHRLFAFGVSQMLWAERPPVIYWRRGIRGFEYFTLYKMVEAVSARSNQADPLDEMTAELEEFCLLAERLLYLEREALGRAEQMTFSTSADPEIAGLRDRLFSSSKSYGGWFKEILDKTDGLLYASLKAEPDCVHEDIAPETGLLHIYTGDGKGKSTASAGLALRARSRGLRVLYAQFMKTRDGGETDALGAFGIDVMRFKNIRSPLFHPDMDIGQARLEVRSALSTLSAILDRYDLVVLDEFVTLVCRGLLDESLALEFTRNRPKHLEFVITGRGVTEALLEAADLVSEIKAVKHPYSNGTRSRAGIEY